MRTNSKYEYRNTKVVPFPRPAERGEGSAAAGFLLLIVLMLAGAVSAAEIQIKTVDGQTIQGEHLGTQNGVVKLRTAYGVISIPEKNVVTVSMAPASDKPKSKPAPEEPVSPAAPQTFPLVKPPNMQSLVAKRLAEKPVQEPDKRDRQELHRAIRNFADSSDSSRQKIIKQLQGYGPGAYEYINAAYAEPFEFDDKVDLLRTLAVPGRALTAAIFAGTHEQAVRLMDRTATEPPAAPPDYLSKRERERPQGKSEQLKAAAANVLKVEEYASTAGGPYNSLFLLEIYKKRYTAEQVDPLLNNISRDSTRLGATGADAGRAKSSWTAEDRVLLAEQVFPLVFRDNEDLKSLATALLKKILPSGHPQWDASQAEWAEWWESAKDKLVK